MSATASQSSSERHKHSSNARYGEPDIDITKDEFTRIQSALQKEEFRKMFLEYVEEIQDPANRKQYEEEITQLEAERGVDVTFVHPEPGFVVKTSLNGELKCFVNLAKSDVIEKPSGVSRENPETGAPGFQWAIPLAQTGPRDDLDAHGKRCRVFDVVFHPDALYMAERSKQFRLLLIDTALDGVEREFKVKLDRNNLKFPNLKYKGVARATVIRKRAKHPSASAAEPHPLADIYPPLPAESTEPRVLPMKQQSTAEPKREFTEPKYVIKHRRDVDMAEFTNELDAKLNLTVPRMLVVEIELPLLSSTADCVLDVTPQSLYLRNERPGAKYLLKIDLPFLVNDKEGNARFAADKRRLCVELPVVQQSAEQQRSMHNALLHLSREDSGVESDVREDTTSNHSTSPVEELHEEEEEVANDSVIAGLTAKSEDTADAKAKTSNKISSVNDGPFLKRSIQYQFPAKFDCNVLDNVMSLVLDVRNVQPESIELRQRACDVHIKFISLGSGYYPSYHAFYLKLPANSEVVIDGAHAEAWENNVVLNVNLATSGENLHKFWAGLDAGDLKEYSVEGKFHVARSSRQRKKSPPAELGVKLSSSLDVSVERSDCERSLEIEIKPREQLSTGAANTTEDEDHDGRSNGADAQPSTRKLSKKQRKKNKKRRSLSESACDDIKAYQKHQQEEKKEQQLRHKQTNRSTDNGDSNATVAAQLTSPTRTMATESMAVPMAATNGAQQRKQRSYSESRNSFIDSSSESATLPVSSCSSAKGILKHYSRYAPPRQSISDSCSSVDDYASSSSYSCSADAGGAHSLRFSQYFCDIPEENSTAGLSESCKKTVRFNEVIMKQVFRHDSSILGQRKKNQKRRDRKQRAIQRRHSEGDSADYEEHKPVDLDVINRQYLKLKNMNDRDKRSQHDSGLDLTACGDNTPNGAEGLGGCALKKAANIDGKMLRSRFESDASVSEADAAKNSMMFDMDM